jgi:hypothetical protein
MPPSTIQFVAAVLFAVALIHTCSTKFFDHLGHTRPARAGVSHLLGEIEVVFGFSTLKGHFEDQTIHPLGLLAAAFAPTISAILAFRLL